MLWSTGCGSDFSERSEIDSFRFLAVQADPSWLRPGETSTLRPRLAGGRALSYQWSWCPLRGPNSLQFECLLSVEELESLAGVDLPDNLYDLGLAPTAQVPYFVPAEAIQRVCDELGSLGEVPNLTNLPDCDGTFPISVRVDVSNGERVITAFKNVRLIYDPDLAGPPNETPDISFLNIDILRGGRRIEGPLAFDRTYLIQLGPDPGATNPLEQLDRLSERTDDDGSREQLSFAWYATAGEFDDNRTGFLPETIRTPERPDGIPIEEAWDTARSNPWTSPRPADFRPGDTVIFYLVIRDDRGGTLWTLRTATIGQSPS